ncbi:hypothetical protein WAE61_01670 [Comamonadaceae bacterium PP-2]
MIEKIYLAVSALCVSCVSIAGGVGVEDDSKRAWSAEGSKSRVMTHSQAVDELKAYLQPQYALPAKRTKLEKQV